MTKYDDTSFHPPAPVAHATLRNSANDSVVANVLMLIDTGADVSLIPQKVATRLKLKTIEDTQYQLSSFDGAENAVRLLLDGPNRKWDFLTRTEGETLSGHPRQTATT